MYRLDIITDIGTFTVHEKEIEETGAKSPEDVAKLQPLLNDILAGNFFLGYIPGEDENADPYTVAIGKDARYKAYVFRGYRKPEPVTEEPTGPQEGVVEPFTARVEYLGNKLTVTGCQLYVGGITHILPVKVNDEYHPNYIKQEALQQLLMAWLEQVKGIPVTDYLVIVPDVAMDFATSAEYLLDYVGGIETESAGKNAKAWNGWRPDQE